MSASSSTSVSDPTVSEQRPQAGPLPVKRGEIGFREGMSVEPIAPPPAAVVMPERHPADRDAPPPHSASASSQATPSAPSESSHSTTTAETDATSTGGASETVTADDASSTSTVTRHKRLLFFLRRKKVPTFKGILLTTLLLFLLQLFVIIATIAAWAVSIIMLTHGGSMSSDNDNNGDSSNDVPPGASTAIFVHVVFGIILLGQLLFFERRVYRLRAERYAFLHPGEMLPTSYSRSRTLNDPYISLSPWNRPPLPTYAAALAQSGVGTGDVEDHLIAQPPPPAYGNTRGSRLLLTGFLRDSLRAQRPASVHSARSQRTIRPGDSSTIGETVDDDRSRPVSYVTIDEEWEIIQGADRARQLEETLSRLERPPSSSG